MVSNEELRAQAKRTAPQIKVAAGLWVLGMMIIAAAAVTWVVLAVVAGDYYSNSKVVRDGAEAGSALLPADKQCWLRLARTTVLRMQWHRGYCR